MTHEEIIKAWFAIDEMGGENVCTELYSFHHPNTRTKMYFAAIEFGWGSKFMSQNDDVYKAMENAINKYSEFKTKIENK